jgi:sulfate transport system substrate-binding protein
VVTLVLACDIDAIHEKAGLVPADWQKRPPPGKQPGNDTALLFVNGGMKF